MMHQIIENSHGHPLKKQKILLPSDYPCACSQGKLVVKSSPSKVIVRGNYLSPPSTTSHCQNAPMN
jgi:hypothetical protein